MPSYAKELLLEDYRYRSESLWRNEQGGETRVNLFIGLVTLALAVVGAFSGDAPPEVIRPSHSLILGVLTALLCLGITTMLRMVTRNRNTDEAKHQLDLIRQTFKDHFDDEEVLKDYSLFKPGAKGMRIKPRRFGGLSHTMAVINGLIMAVMAAVLIDAVKAAVDIQLQSGTSTLIGLIVVIWVFLCAVWMQVKYVEAEEKKARDNLHLGEPTHAGGIVFKRDGDGLKYLVAGARSTQGEWILPKGHINKGEDHTHAALREVREETGCLAKVICLVDRMKFLAGEEEVDCKYYLMENVYEGPRREGREVRWMNVDEALAVLAYPESRYLIARAEQVRQQREASKK